VEGLTLRAAGEALGVSRTALYRHFSDKQALVAGVAREGFRTLRLALVEAWERTGRGQAGFQAMGEAYLQFAVTHPSHYRVMFGRFVESGARDPHLIQEAEAAFQALVDALVAQQREAGVRADDPILLARFVWSVVHGIAMLTIDGQLRDGDESVTLFNRYASQRLQAAIAAAPSSSGRG
jgi:AcrR family transcriptional regulator